MGDSESYFAANGREVRDAVRGAFADSTHVDALSQSFSLFAWDALKDQLEHSTVRLLLWRDWQHAHLNGGHSENLQRARLDQHRIARECTTWSTDHLSAKEVTRTIRETWLSMRGSASVVVEGAGFESEALGLVASHDAMLFTSVERSTERVARAEAIMDKIWHSTDATRLVDEEFRAALRVLSQDNTPESAYLRILTALFEDFVDAGTDAFGAQQQMGFFDSEVWKKLYSFQRDGVLGVIEKLERHNGCILADSVGLGKTFEALAVIKFYELRNDRVLVLAPKRLRENWTLYRANDGRNPLAGDRLRYDVLNHTDLTRSSGISGDIDLAHLNWGNYDLVVIDESHNFRNTSPSKSRVTRYQRLMDEVLRSGVKTKVLMLSATPVNTRLADLKNQVLFATEGDDRALSGEGIASIESTLRQAQMRFRAWQEAPESQRSAKSLVSHLGFDYVRLLDLMTIARSRKHIEKYYSSRDVGSFPVRRPPINIKSAVDADDALMPLAEVNRHILGMNLAAYKPMSYVFSGMLGRYEQLYDYKWGTGSKYFAQTDRENNIVHLMRVNLLKRLESSTHSITMTLRKLLSTVRAVLDAIEAFERDPGRSLSLSEIEGEDWSDLDFEDPMFEDAVIGTRVKILLSDIDRRRWRQDLHDDLETLQLLQEEFAQITPSRDLKLQRLRGYVREKVTAPFNDGNRKVLIFTAFSDTAEYLYAQLREWARDELGIHVGLITGSSTRSTLPLARTDMHSVLQRFSPLSKGGDEHGESIDLLIGTDAISEGQNLQDCDTVVNYDIHWNPVRIVQRFGRVDRIGTRSTSVQLVNFWPDIDLETYINLEKRVSGRMALLDVSATGEENLLTQNEQKAMNDLDYRRMQLEQMQTTAPSMEDLAGGLSITDLTLSDFRMDIASHDHADLETVQSWPLALFAVARFQQSLATDGLAPGAVFLLRVRDGQIPLTPSYPLAPHLLLYVTDDGSLAHPVEDPKLALDVLRLHGTEGTAIDVEAVREFARSTQDGRDMRHYRRLLAAAVAAASRRGSENRVASLFSAGATQLGAGDDAPGLDVVDLVAWMALVP
ncbi:helicase-related protein [Agrococcus sp. ARC_14]|uniref:helicase-related protein n=1 Tax=Agrococcus sp. ARC_14 TaxID=2919927 RepID=UPI001F05D6C6|nr:helicase-related protein [Agrococcus sp. ARC_14]MCH1883951.1 SNF2-related protein [Agrococcus sp. ARC_14]